MTKTTEIERPVFEAHPEPPRTLCTNCGQPAYLSVLWANSYPGTPVHSAQGVGQYCHTEYANEQVFGKAARGLTALEINERIKTDPKLTIAHLSDEDRQAIARWRQECSEIDGRNATRRKNYNDAVAGVRSRLFIEVKVELFGPEPEGSGYRVPRLTLQQIGQVHREADRRLAELGLTYIR